MVGVLRTCDPLENTHAPKPALRIAGFGACMISGYPHQGGGLFEVGCAAIEKSLLHPVQSIFVSLGGFPAPRALCRRPGDGVAKVASARCGDH